MISKKVYISGPMTGIKNFNREAFNRASLELRIAGHIALNPARHPVGLEYGEYMSYAMLDIFNCDYVFLLPGWENSPGAKREVALAKQQGKELFNFTTNQSSLRNSK